MGLQRGLLARRLAGLAARSWSRTGPARRRARPTLPYRRRPHPGCVPPTSRSAMIVTGGTGPTHTLAGAGAGAGGGRAARGADRAVRVRARRRLRPHSLVRGAAPVAAGRRRADRRRQQERAAHDARRLGKVDRARGQRSRRSATRCSDRRRRCRRRRRRISRRCAASCAATSSSGTSRATLTRRLLRQVRPATPELLRVPRAAGVRPRPAPGRIHGHERRQQPLLRLRARRARPTRCDALHAAGIAQTGLPGEITVVHAGGLRVACSGSRRTPTRPRCSTCRPPGR